MLFFGSSIVCAQVKIGDNPNIIHSSALLELSSSEKGFLPPRLSTAQRDLIASPAIGLCIFNTTTNCLDVYVGNGYTSICGEPMYQANYIHCNVSNKTPITAVINPVTGKTWMDRNLGSSFAATHATDSTAFGSLFQWGRLADGHQCINRFTSDGVVTSATTDTLSSLDIPGHPLFIMVDNPPNDWRSPHNTFLWNGLQAANNPCPSLYRIPTQAEWNEERLSWSSNNAAGAFNSPLKLVLSGFRNRTDANLVNVGLFGYYWSSSASSAANSHFLLVNNFDAFMASNNRAFGMAVRCIKN